jgi:hypothetical protein
MREQLKRGAASVGNRAPPHGAGLARRCPGRRFFVPSAPTETAATQRTSQRAERAIDSAMREQLKKWVRRH